MSRLHYMTAAPEAAAHMTALSKYLSGTDLGKEFLELIYLRVSQINGCPYCVDLHWRDLAAAGTEPRKLNALTVWRETPFFNERERAALAWAEAVTRLEGSRVPEEEFSRARKIFSEKELADLTFAVAQMNAWNRIAIAFAVRPHEVPRPGQ